MNLLQRFLHRPPSCPLVVTVKWADLPPHKAWPSRLQLPFVRRNVAGRKTISGILGTRDWLWTGKSEITAYANSTRGPLAERGFGVTVETECPVAVDSPDHLETLKDHGASGPTTDNSRNRTFTENLYKLFPGRRISLLDLGCSGGGFALDVLMDRNFAMGLEGSDFCRKTSRGAWGVAPHSFFTCDVSRPFQVKRYGLPVRFDVVTSWEMIEHIALERLPTLLANIKRHLVPNGFFIGSISPAYGPPFHQWQAPQSWWEPFWQQHGFRLRPDLVKHFQGQFVRGPNNNADGSFVLAADVEKI